MSWVMVGVAAVGAIKGGIDANNNRKQQKKHDAYRKKAIEMSPWTGMSDPGAGNFGNQDTFSGMLGGGMQGAMIGQSFGGGAAAPTGGGGGGNLAMADQSVMQGQMMKANDPMKYMNQQSMGGGQSPWTMMA